MPFQFSLHIISSPGAEPEHHGFLGDGTEDPRPTFLAKLKSVLGDHGNIIVYNQSFEKDVLVELGEAFSNYTSWVQEICDRVVDLYPPFRSFSYYHPNQHGSASLKMVLPALTGKGYDNMGISKGDDASLAFFNMVMGSYSSDQKTKIMQDLEEYCALDTEGMIWIVDALRRA